MEHTMTRRDFLTNAVLGTTAFALLPGIAMNTKPVLAADGKSRVVVGTHSQLVNASEQIEPKIVRAVIEDLLVTLTSAASIRDAWLALFPTLQTTDVIGVKVNCINPQLSSHPDVVSALAESFISAVDLNPNNLLIWDRTDGELKNAGYTLNATETGIRCFGTNSQRGKIGYDPNVAVDVGNGTSVHLSRILTEMCTYLINVPVLKDHGTAGVTLSLKNHYGSIDHPGSCHGNQCDPYAAQLNTAPHIKDKTKLIVCDALYGIYKGGPGGRPQWINRQLLASTDPVALDTVGMSIIDQQRQAKKLSLLSKRVKYLRTAASLGLGTDQIASIEQLVLQAG